MWVCKYCYQENLGRANVCEHCGRARNKLPAAGSGKQAPRAEEIPYKRPAEDAPKAEPTELPKVQQAEKPKAKKEKKDKDYIQLGFLRISPSMLLLFFVLSLCVYVLDSGEESSADAKPGAVEIAAQEESFYGAYSPASDGSYSISVDGETRTLQCVNEPMGERRPGMRYGLDKKGIYLELTLQFRPYMREDNWVFELNPDQFVASARDKRPEELRRLVFDQRVKLRIEYDGKEARVDTIEFM